MEDAFAESYNNKNTDSIKYYSEDAVSFQMVNAFGRKKAIHESMKSELLTFPKGSKIAFETQEIHASNDGNMVVEVGDTTLPTHKHKTNSGHFMSLFKRRTASTFASEIWGLQTRHWHRLKRKTLSLKCLSLLYTKRIYLLVQR
jgi:ketosteroid isomerase-like protein